MVASRKPEARTLTRSELKLLKEWTSEELIAEIRKLNEQAGRPACCLPSHLERMTHSELRQLLVRVTTDYKP